MRKAMVVGAGAAAVFFCLWLFDTQALFQLTWIGLRGMGWKTALVLAAILIGLVVWQSRAPAPKRKTRTGVKRKTVSKAKGKPQMARKAPARGPAGGKAGTASRSPARRRSRPNLAPTR